MESAIIIQEYTEKYARTETETERELCTYTGKVLTIGKYFAAAERLDRIDDRRIGWRERKVIKSCSRSGRYCAAP